MSSLDDIKWLPDVNFWLALSADRHEHNEVAIDWLARISGSLYFCRVSQMGFLRLLTNPKVMGGEVLNVRAAFKAYHDLLADERIEFAPEPSNIERKWAELMRGPIANNNSWTDAYLAAFALESGFKIVSFDKGLKRWPLLSLELLPRMTH